MYNFATDSLFIICFNSLILVIYCGFSGGTRRDTGCLFLSFPTSVSQVGDKRRTSQRLDIHKSATRETDIQNIIHR